MKILQIIQKPQKRGAEIFTCQLSNHLVNLGHNVKIVALYKGQANMPFNGEIISLNASPKSRFFDISAWFKLFQIIRGYKPDIIQVNAGDTLKYAVFSKLLFGWRNTIISRNASEIGKYLKSSVHKKINTYLYKNVDHVISVSQASEHDLLNNFPFLSGKTEIIPVGIEKNENVVNIIWKNEKVKNIVHVGGFTFEKNHIGLLNIFLKVLDTNEDVNLHLLGDGPLRCNIEKKVKELNLDHKILFYGFVDNPLSYISSADILVLPSIIEGLPGVLLEAMFVKTPIIAYNVGGISEIINSSTGILIEKNNEDQFVKEIINVLTDRTPMLIDTAYELVNNKYLNYQLALKFINCYHNILSTKY
jgi:L-malate glycosyltransferase